MKTLIEKERVALVDSDGSLMGEVLFPSIEGQIEITHTFVDEKYRGQGLAKILLDTVVDELRKRQQKALPLCSYSQAYFAKYPDKSDVIQR